MSGIAGFYQTDFDFTQILGWQPRLNVMRDSLLHRGPDDKGSLLAPHAGLAHTQLTVKNTAGGHQPIQKNRGSETVSIVLDGELFNTKELKELLSNYSLFWESDSDAEFILNGYLAMGASFFEKLNGVFAFAIYDSSLDALLLVRDPLGAKPLFYQREDTIFVFGSEPKALFAYGIKPSCDKQGYCELFGLGPARTPGLGVFSHMREVLPGHLLLLKPDSCTNRAYSILSAREHTDSYEETVEKVTWLIRDSVKRQMGGDLPICTLLSGGLDSSLISAICGQELKARGELLDTFSFDFSGSTKHFQPNSFQSTLDRPYVDIMKEFIGSSHTYLECDSRIQADYLGKAVDARDLPCMADVEASLLYFCSLVSTNHKVALTGECADEIFGGYPWFHREEMWQKNTFPWSSDLGPRTALLREDFKEYLNLQDYVQNAYEVSLAETPRLESDDGVQAKLREVSWLTLRWFMATLLNRMDRASMYSGLSGRVPFADLRILQYAYNIPWEMKRKGGIVKNLLVETGKGLLPDQVLYRKKSPYPKTYDPSYEKLLSDRLMERITDSASPISNILDRAKVESFLSQNSDYGKPWYGQLMAGPQMLAYLLQMDYWMAKYRISV